MDLHLSLRHSNHPPFPQPPLVPALPFSPCPPPQRLPIHFPTSSPQHCPSLHRLPLSSSPRLILPLLLLSPSRFLSLLGTCSAPPFLPHFPITISAPLLLHCLQPHLPFWQTVTPSGPALVFPPALPTAVCPRSTAAARQLPPAFCQQPISGGQPSPSGCTPLSLTSSPARGCGWVAPASHASRFPQPGGCFQGPGTGELLIGFGRAA